MTKKHPIYEQLRAAGRLDQAISELERRQADDPQSAMLPAVLGQLYLGKLQARNRTEAADIARRRGLV